jgi:hypothetical protein
MLIHVCRSAWLTPAAYGFYRAILLTFLERGRAPTTTELETLAQRHGIVQEEIKDTLQTFERQDLIQRDPATGAIAAAYPFSGVPTIHRVHLENDAGTETLLALSAMCAIDALGIPLMLHHAARIDSRDAITGDPVQVRIVPTAEEPLRWHAVWEPVEAVVYARPEGHEHEHDCGSSAAGSCCGLTQFFTDVQHAATWSVNHSAPDGRIYTQDEAVQYAATLFAGILDRAGASPPSQPRPGQGPHVQLLYFRACPNTPRALEVLRAVLVSVGLPTDVELIAVETQEAAELHQFYGSPTVRIDGKDVSPTSCGATPSLSCRLYPEPGGRVAHHPPAEVIAAALRQALAAER